MSARGVLTLCRCGAPCTATGARSCDCEPVGRVNVAIPPTTLARVALLSAALGGGTRALRDAAWLVRGGEA